MKPGEAGRSMDTLGVDEKRRLEEAQRRLRDSVAAYEHLRSGALPPGEDIESHGRDETAQAQAAIESAEEELWRAREDLLGWKRPTSALKAVRTSEWFSDEDAVYDDLDPRESTPRAG